MLLNTSALNVAVFNGAAAVIGTQVSLSASAACVGSATAGVANTVSVSANVYAVVGSTGAASLVLPLAGSTSAATSTVCGLSITAPLSANVGSTPQLIAEIAVSKWMQGASVGHVDSFAAIEEFVPIASLEGTSAVSNAISADTNITKNVSGLGQSDSIAIGDLSNTIEFGAFTVSNCSAEADAENTIVLATYVDVVSGSINTGGLNESAVNESVGYVRPAFCEASSAGYITVDYVASASAISDVLASADAALEVILGGFAYVEQEALAEVIQEVSLGGEVVSITGANAGAALVKPIFGAVSVSPTTTADLNKVDPLGSLSGAGAVSNVAAVTAIVVKPLGATSNVIQFASAAAKVSKPLLSSVTARAQATADLKKTDTLQGLQGTGAIVNVASVNASVKKPLGGAAPVLVAVHGKAIFTHFNDLELLAATSATVESGAVYADTDIGNVFADVVVEDAMVRYG